MDNKEIIKQLIDYYANGNVGKFAEKIGVAPNTVSMWKSRGNIDYKTVFTKCENLNGNWLLGGAGEMLLTKTSPDSQEREDGKKAKSQGTNLVNLARDLQLMKALLRRNEDSLLEIKLSLGIGQVPEESLNIDSSVASKKKDELKKVGKQ